MRKRKPLNMLICISKQKYEYYVGESREETNLVGPHLYFAGKWMDLDLTVEMCSSAWPKKYLKSKGWLFI